MVKKKNAPEAEEIKEQQPAEATTDIPEQEEAQELPKEPTELEKAVAEKEAEHERYLLLAAEYDNFRKRTIREKDSIYQNAKADTAGKFLPIYDNLLRALQNETVDEAYKKGVEMTMTELKKILASLGIEPFGAVGDVFDPTRHNAVMHVEDEALGENVIAELFQTGFAMGEKVIRFAMVKVAN